MLAVPASTIDDILAFLITLTTKRVELVSIEGPVRHGFQWYLQRSCTACISLLSLQNVLECVIAPLPCFGSLAMARAYFIACGSSAILALCIENFLRQCHRRIAVQA